MFKVRLLFLLIICATCQTQQPTLRPQSSNNNQPEADVLGRNRDEQFDPTTTQKPVSSKLTEVSLCACDKSRDICDIGCCCDSDCSPEDLNVFTSCIDVEDSKTKVRCINGNQFAFVQTESFIDFDETHRKKICLSSDDDSKKNYAIDGVQTTNNLEYFTKLIRLHSDEIILPDKPALIAPEIYRYGDPILVCRGPETSEEVCAIDTLLLPLSERSCDNEQTVTYMKSKQSSCLRKVDERLDSDDLICRWNRNSALYYFDQINFVKAPSLFYQLHLNISYSFGSKFYPGTVLLADLFDMRILAGNETVSKAILHSLSSPVEASCYDNEGANIECDAPSLNDGICYNVVSSVSYRIIYSSGFITQVQAVIRVRNFPVDQLKKTYRQSFSISFRSENKKDFKLVKSNFELGSSVPAAISTRRNIDDSEFQIMQLVDDGLSFAGAAANGHCSEMTPRQIVKFGMNSSTGCLLKFEGSCIDIQNRIYDLAIGIPGDSPSHVARFRNSDVLNPSQWLPILNDSVDPDLLKPVGSRRLGTCKNLRTQAVLRIIYANTGTKFKPKYQILGAAYDYGAQKNLDFPCNDGAEPCPIVIRFGVQFEDVTSMVTVKENERFFSSTDFFYPFFMNAPSSKAANIVSDQISLPALLLLTIFLLS